MLPKNSKHFLQPTSEKLNMNLSMIEDVINFYYVELRKALSNLEFYNIQVENLGSFQVKKRELPKLVMKYTNHLNVIQPDTFNQMVIKKDIEEKLEKVLNIQSLLYEDIKRKKEFYKKKIDGFKKDMEQ